MWDGHFVMFFFGCKFNDFLFLFFFGGKQIVSMTIEKKKIQKLFFIELEGSFDKRNA